jgi:hypothetical protein
MIKAGGSSSEGSSLSVLEMNLDVITIHALQHLSGQFEPTKSLELSL